MVIAPNIMEAFITLQPPLESIPNARMSPAAPMATSNPRSALNRPSSKPKQLRTSFPERKGVYAV